MPRKLELEAIEAELAAVSSLLSRLPEDSDPIGHFQLTERKEALQIQLEDLRREHRHPASVALIFGGAPVLGARGIQADFAGKSLEHFQSIVSRRFAEMEVGDLGQRGPIPMQRDTNLLITQTVRGSFGFILEESDLQSSIAETELKAVITDVVNLLNQVSAPNDELFEEAVSRIESRTLSSLKDFLSVLDDGDATMRLVDDDREHDFDQHSLHRARVRVDMTEVSDRETDYIEGVLQGLLPDHRKFEFRQSKDAEVIYGSISYEFARTIRGQVGDLVGKQWRARFKIREIRRRNFEPRLRYSLIELAEV